MSHSCDVGMNTIVKLLPSFGDLLLFLAAWFWKGNSNAGVEGEWATSIVVGL